MDYNDAPLWKGREAHHKAAIDAALKVGVKHIYYTSLAFASPSKAGVMRAHIRTEKYLSELRKKAEEKGREGLDYTIIREGLYNESWPLYLGYYYGLKEETRKEVVVAGDGPISWTSIADMAFGTARIVAGPSEKWTGKTIYLSQNRNWRLRDVAEMVTEVRQEIVKLKVVSKDEHIRHYVEEKGMDRAAVEWWASTYEALEDGECDIQDSTLEKMLWESGRKPKSMRETIVEMLQ